MIETLLTKPYWVIDILPERVPDGCSGQFFAVERFYLRGAAYEKLRAAFTDILLKVNCYHSLRLCGPEDEDDLTDPPPEVLAERLIRGERDWRVVLPEENALFTLNREDTCMTVYNPSPGLLRLLRKLVRAGGLYLWQPPREKGDAP